MALLNGPSDKTTRNTFMLRVQSIVHTLMHVANIHTHEGNNKGHNMYHAHCTMSGICSQTHTGTCTTIHTLHHWTKWTL
jgi:hypothetical protein